MFDNLTRPNKYMVDLRKPFDPTNYPAFKRFETGYSLFFVLDIPVCLAKLTEVEKGEKTGISYKAKYKDLITTYIQILEREFTGLQGLENITSETIDFEGKNEMTVSSINKVSENLNPTITLSYTEPYGATLTKVHELFLRGIDDTVVGRRKHYNGLIDDGILAPSFANEVFKFLYIVTDNTGFNLEKSYLIFNAQPTTSALGDLYNSEHDTHETKEVTCEFKCNAVTGEVINAKAREILSAVTGIKYTNDNSTGKNSLERASKAVVIYDSNIPEYTKENTTGNLAPYNKTGMDFDYAAPKAFTGNKLGLGTLVNEADDQHLRALYRQLNQPYSPVEETQYSVVANSVGSSNNPVVEDGDPTSPNNPAADWEIDSPILKPGDEVYVINGATGLDAHDDIGKVKWSGSIALGETVKGTVVRYVTKSGALEYAKKKQIHAIYQNSKLHPYKIKLHGSEPATGNWCFRIQDIYIVRDGKLVSAYKHRAYDESLGLVCTDNPKFKKGDWVIIKPSAKYYNTPYQKSDGSNKQYSVVTGNRNILTQITYVLSSNVANTVAKDSGTSNVYGTYAVYGISTKDGSYRSLYLKEQDLENVKILNELNLSNVLNIMQTLTNLKDQLDSKKLANVESVTEFLKVIESKGVLPEISTMAKDGWVG